MKFTVSLVVHSFLVAATSASAASVAHVYLSNTKNSHVPASISVSPSTARFIFAQRLGAAQYHALGDADSATVNALNDFGGRRHTLFSGDEDEDRIRLLYIIEGSERPEDIISTDDVAKSNFTILSPPSPEANARLQQDFQHQLIAVANAQGRYSKNRVQDERLSEFWHTLGGNSGDVVNVAMNRGVVRALALDDASSKQGSSSPEYQAAVASIRSTIDHLFAKSISDDWDVIVVVMPPKSSTGLFKRSTASSWGKYSMPSKRQLEYEDSPDEFADMATEEHPANEVPSLTEEPAAVEEPAAIVEPAVIEEPAAIEPAALPNSDTTTEDTSGGSFLDAVEDWFEDTLDSLTSTVESINPITTLQQQDTTPPRGILPACYTTMSDCISTTHNCSGHGSCYLKYSDASRGSCYVCGCRASRYNNGSQVTRWAGPACQKVDISVPFWIIGSTVVGLLGALAWGVGILYAMGSQDLPSVLSAGVAGPRAK